MVEGFDTTDADAAAAALIVYAIYRSRDHTFHHDPRMWGRIERAIISSAKRAEGVADFVQKLKPKLHCPSIRPVADQGAATWERLLRPMDGEAGAGVLRCAYRRASYVVLLVRDRLARERPARSEETSASAGADELPGDETGRDEV